MILFHNTRQNLDERRFPSAIVPEQRHNFTRIDFEVDMFNGADAAVVFLNSLGLQNRFHETAPFRAPVKRAFTTTRLIEIP